MALTKEQNDEINKMRHEIQNMLAALDQLARNVGAEPMPMAAGDPIPPNAPPNPFDFH